MYWGMLVHHQTNWLKWGDGQGEALIYISWRWWLDGSGDGLGSNGYSGAGQNGLAQVKFTFLYLLPTQEFINHYCTQYDYVNFILYES